MVSAALVVMTILGCDDSVSQCHYVDTVKGSWETVAACDAQSQKKLPSYTNVHYPVVVAMCETSADAPIAQAAGKTAQAAAPPAMPPLPETPAPAPVTVEAAPEPPASRPLPQRAYALIKGVLPDGHRLKEAIIAPVHYLGDGYSWVARKVSE